MLFPTLRFSFANVPAPRLHVRAFILSDGHIILSMTNKIERRHHEREKVETDVSDRADFSAGPVTSVGYPRQPIAKAAINLDEW